MARHGSSHRNPEMDKARSERVDRAAVVACLAIAFWPLLLASNDDKGRPLPELIASLKSPEATVRLEAAKILAGMGPKATPAIPILWEALKDENDKVRLYAASALGRTGKDILPR